MHTPDTTHTAHSTPHIITQISEITQISYTLQFTQTQNTHKQKNHNTQPVNPPSRSKKTFSPSRDLLLPCCESDHLLLRPWSVAVVLRPAISPSSRSAAARPAVHELLLCVHRSVAENPSVIYCRGRRSAVPRLKPPTRPQFLPYVFWILKLSWCIGIYVLNWPVFIDPNWLNLTRTQYDPFLIRTDFTRIQPDFWLDPNRSEYISGRIVS